MSNYLFERTRTWLAGSYFEWNLRIHGCNLDLGWGVVGIRDANQAWIPVPEILAGLPDFTDAVQPGACEKSSGKSARELMARICELRLPAEVAVIVAEAPLLGSKITVSDLGAVLQARVRAVRLMGEAADSAKVRALPVLAGFPKPSCENPAWLFADTRIHEASSRMRAFPQMRRSQELADVDVQIRESYLRAAEAVHGLAPGQGEVLAIFKKVPIAMISRYRLLEERGVLLYTTLASANPTRTRVCDIAAVRDRVRQTTHLVAHQTTYAMAFLS